MAQFLLADSASAQPYSVVVGELVQLVTLNYLTPARAAVEVETRVSLPDGARLERATFGIAASASNDTLVGSIAAVRPGDDGTCVVDFGRMVTVGGVRLTGFTGSVDGVQRWNGATWQGIAGEDAGAFPEVATERLLVTTSGTTDVESAMRDHGSVRLPAQPTNLEVVIDGSTVWFERQGSAPDLVTTDANGHDTVTGVSGTVVYGIDRTDALREAFAAARSVDGMKEVSVRLRASAPGELTLNASISMLHEHTVTFGSSAHSTTVDAAEEGVTTLVLPGPFTAADQIREVGLTLTGSFGPERVEPVDGPPEFTEADLALSPGRAILFGVPASLAARFGELQGLRLKLTSDRGGELAGRLISATGSDGHPGEPVRGAELAPVQVPGGQDGWFSLTFPKAVPLVFESASPIAAWLELVPSYGEIACALTTSTAAEAPGAPVLRRLPGGGTKGLSLLRSATDPALATTLYGALRVIGMPGKRDPIPAVAVSVPGGAGIAYADPTGDDLRVVVGLGAGIAVTDGTVALRVRTGAAGSVTVDNVVVAYRKGGTA